jgi:ABC-type maltose transport system permease subunit
MCLLIYIYHKELDFTAIILLPLIYSRMIIFLLGLVIPSRQQLPSGSFKEYLLILEWLPGYSTALLRTYLWAELIAASVVVPAVMAYVSIACIPFLRLKIFANGHVPGGNMM